MVGNEIRLLVIWGFISAMELRAMVDGQSYGKSEDFIKDFQNLLDALMEMSRHNGNTPDEMIRIMANLMRKKVYPWM